MMTSQPGMRQIEVRAFEKVQIGMKNRIAAMEHAQVRDRMQFYGAPPAPVGLRAVVVIVRAGS